MIRNMTQVRANAIISCALAFLISALTPRVAQAGCNNSPPTCGDPACGRAWCNDNRLAHWQCIASPAGTPCANGGSCTGNVAFGGGETFLDFNCALPGVVSPDFYITHVVYAVPGKSSSMFYASGYTMGSTTSATNSMQQSVTVTATQSTGVIFASGNVSVSTGTQWGSTDSTVTDVAATETSSYTKPGIVDPVNHDDDEIWFLVRPVINATAYTGASSATIGRLDWGFALNQQTPVPYFVYVGELKGTYQMPTDVKAFLDQRNITSSYYPQLLAADPFINGLDPNTTLDTARFTFVNVFPYVPPSAPGNPPGKQTFAITRSLNNSSTTTSSLGYSAGVTVGGDVGFFSLFTASLKVAYNMSWQSQTSLKTSDGTNVGESITVGQPLFGYNGPTVLRVYEDKIWKTYLFTLDWY